MSLLAHLPPEPPLKKAPWMSEKMWQATKAIREKLDSQPTLSPQEAKDMVAKHFLNKK